MVAMKINKFVLAFIATSLYWYLMKALNVESASAVKYAFTLLLWWAAFISITNYIFNYPSIRTILDRHGLLLVNVLIGLNIINILRGILGGHGYSLTTALGNPYNALPLLAPFVAGFAAKSNNIYLINRSLFIVALIGSALALFSIGTIGVVSENKSIDAPWVLINPVIFLIGAIGYILPLGRTLIIMMFLFLFWHAGFIIGSRAAIIRTVLLYLAHLASNIKKSALHYSMLPLSIATTLLISVLIVATSITGENSIFQSVSVYLQNIYEQKSEPSVFTKADTRTFLYVEVINDLIKTESLFFGKGSSGTYFSDYFYTTGHDTDTRLTVEVGVLSIMLKGGIVAVLLNIYIFIYCASNAIKNSNNAYCRWVGYLLLIHVILLFVENLVAFDSYNFCIWFFVGVALSDRILALGNTSTKSLLHGKFKVN